MSDFPTLTTERLVLRAFVPSDGADVERLAGFREVADTTLHIPHPYPVGGGEWWIATHGESWDMRTSLTLAITRRDDATLVGAVGLGLRMEHAHGEIGYWIGHHLWGLGYATEASRALLGYGFTELELHRIQGRHFTRNPASGRVLVKLGMQREGLLRAAYRRWGRFEDVAIYGLLASECRLPPDLLVARVDP